MKAEVVGENRRGRWRENNIQVCVAFKYAELNNYNHVLLGEKSYFDTAQPMFDLCFD